MNGIVTILVTATEREVNAFSVRGDAGKNTASDKGLIKAPVDASRYNGIEHEAKGLSYRSAVLDIFPSDTWALQRSQKFRKETTLSEEKYSRDPW